MDTPNEQQRLSQSSSMSEIAEVQSSVTIILSQVCQVSIATKQILLNTEDIQKTLNKIVENLALILQHCNRTRVSQEATANEPDRLNSSQSDSTIANVSPPEPLREETERNSLSSVRQPDPQTSSVPTRQPEREESQCRLPPCQPSEGARDDSVNVNAELLNANDQPLVLESEPESRWLEQIKPLKSPYYPQVGDEVVYFRQGHQFYFDAVRSGNMYQVDAVDEPWTNISLDAQEFCWVRRVSYELLSSRGKPLRLCSLLLARESVGLFTVRYHDLNGVVDFLILRSLYDKACSPTRRWEVGSRFRCAIEDSWQFGRVVDLKCPLDPERYPDSIFKSMRIKWDDGEELVEVSPWELEPVDDKRLPTVEGSSMPILPDDAQDFIYIPTDKDWPSNRNADCRRILHFFDCLLDVPIVKPFEELIINNTEPNYLAVVCYPIDLATVCARLHNNFYRRRTALLFDLEQLAANIAKVVEQPIKLYGLSNRMRRDLRVGEKYKKIGQILFMIVKGELEEDITRAIEELQYFPESQESELAPGDNEGNYEPSNYTQSDECSISTQATNYIIAGANWQIACQRLFNKLWDNKASELFKTRNNEDSMHLQFIREDLQSALYKTPVQFANDVKKVLRMRHKKGLSTQKEIYKEAKVLRNLFDPEMKEIIAAWRADNKSGIARRKRKSSELQQNVDDTEDSDIISPSKKHKNSINRGAGTSGNHKQNFVQDDSEHEKSDIENDDNSDSIPCRTRSRTSKNDEDESNSQMDDNTSTEYYSSLTDTESDDLWEEDEDKEESCSQIALAERIRRSKIQYKSSKKQKKYVGRPRKRLGSIDASIQFTSAEDIMKYRLWDLVYITGVVAYENLQNQFSLKNNKELKILEFTINNDAGNIVHCKAWEKDINRIKKMIKQNNVVRIDNALAIPPTVYGKGTVQHYELRIKEYTEVKLLGRKRSY